MNTVNTSIRTLPLIGRLALVRAFAGKAMGGAMGCESTKPSVARAGAHPQWAYGSEDASPPGGGSV